MPKIQMLAPAQCGGFSHAGEAYLPDRDGTIELPEVAVDTARSHGFTMVAEAKTPPGKKGR